MLSLLFFTKLSAVLTVLYAGLNVHQITSSYAYLLGKIDRFRAALAQAESASGLMRLNLAFYVVLPGAYLSLLRFSAVDPWVLGALALKFACTAGLDIRAERLIVAGGDYSPRQHVLSRCDNALNLAASAVAMYALLKPVGLFS